MTCVGLTALDETGLSKPYNWSTQDWERFPLGLWSVFGVSHFKRKLERRDR